MVSGWCVWLPKNLTDGDPGQDSGKGYTSVVLGRDAADSYNFENEPITFTFDLGGEKSFDTLRLYPRTDAAAKSGNECANYPKKYTLQVSQDGVNWTDIDLNGDAEGTAYTVDYLRNTVLFPEVQTEAAHCDTEFGGSVTAKKVKISVSQVGPAVYEANDVDKENRLQIMELELWNGSENVAAGKVPTVSTNKPFEFGDTWRAQNLTDGDYGTESDKGYSTDILGRMGTTFDLEQPLTIEFDFDEAVRFSSLRIFPRSTKDSIIGGIYPNYPKKYTVSVSEDGENWTDIATEDKGMVRKQEELRDMKLSTRTYSGVVRAQTGLPGRMSGKYDQSPVNACIYSGNKEGSTYPGGEVNVIAEYSGADLFQDGVELKKGQTMVVNMGQNLTAVPNIRFSAPMGTVATMRFAEMLNDGSESGNGATQADGPKGSIYQKSLRGARSQVKYVFAGDGVEEYQPRMSFFGYQYVELTATEDMVVHGLVSKGISSVSEQTGQIVTNNQDVNKLFNNVLFGQMSNYFTAPTDCNQRDERLSWTGDTQAFAQTAVYNFDSYVFLQDMQEIFDENTQKNGYVAAVTDCVDTNEFFGNWAAGWSDVLIIVPWVLYQQTGDDAFLADNWQYLEKYMTFLKEHERAANQCWIPDNARNFGDWLSFQGTSIEVIYDYYYGYMNQIMAEIAGILGKETEKAAYEQKFQDIKEKFLESHVTFEDGNLVIKSGEGQAKYQFMYDAGKGGKWENNSQTSLLWMLKLGFYSNEEMKAAAEKLLIENIRNIDPPADSIRAEAEKNTLAVGFLGSNVITPVLSDIGNAEVSYDLLLQEGLPSWLFEVKAGATTVWERWNSYTPGKGFGDSEMNSFNHYAYGSVVEWMYRYMAGISSDVENPGFKHIILQPTLDTGVQYNNEERINRVDASYESLYGRIESSWKSADGEMTSYHARVPANTTATLYLPVENVIEENLPQMAGLSVVKMTEHNGRKAAEFTLESGTYDISVRDFALSGNDDIKTVMISDIVTRKGIEPEFPETALAEYESGKTRVLKIDGWEGLTGNIYGTAGEKNIQASVGGKKWQVKLIVKDKKDCLLADYSFDAGEDGLTDALTAQEDGAEQRKAVKDGAGKDQIKLVEGLKGNALELPGGSSDQKNTGAVILPDDLLKKSDGKWADDFTISMFLKCADNGFSFAMSLLGKDSDNYIGFVNRTGNGNLISLGAKMSGKVSGEAKKDDGCVKDEWQHFALVVNGSKGKLEIYKNGSLLAEGALEFKPSALAAGMASGHNMLGRGEYSDPDYKGIYDEFQIYDGNLTQPEIKEICDDVLHTTPPDDDNKDKEKAAIESLLEEMNAKGGVTVDEDKNVSLRLSPKTTEDGEFVLPDTCHEDLGVTWEVDEESVIDIKTKPGFAKVEIPDVGEEEKKAKLTASIKLKADGAETETTVKVVFNCMAGTTRDEVLTEALQAQIEAVENYNQQDYTEKTWSVFAAALETARTALTEHSSTESVNLAEKELKDAAAKLERRKGEEEPTEEDVKALDSALKAAYAEKAELEQSKNDYTPESWAEYEAALEAVQEVYDRASKKPAEATAAEVQAARDKLADAKSKLILKAGQIPDENDWELLADAIRKAEALAKDKDQYQADQKWKDFEKAWKDAQEISANNSATKIEVTAAAKALDDAMKGVNKKAAQEPEPSHPTKIRISGSRSLKIAAKRKVTLKASITPDKARKMGVAWSIAPKDKKYASVSKKGVVTTKKAGIGKTIVVTAMAKDGSGKKATVKIKIMKNAVTKITLKAAKKVKAGRKVTVRATVKTNGKKANKKLAWKSSNKKWASVSSKGVVTAKKAGRGKTVTITAASTDGTNKKAKIRIKITK